MQLKLVAILCLSILLLLGSLSIATSYEDVKGKVVSTTSSNGEEKKYSYDVHGRLVSVMDSKGNVTTYQYSSPEATVPSQTNGPEPYPFAK